MNSKGWEDIPIFTIKAYKEKDSAENAWKKLVKIQILQMMLSIQGFFAFIIAFAFFILFFLNFYTLLSLKSKHTNGIFKNMQLFLQQQFSTPNFDVVRNLFVKSVFWGKTVCLRVSAAEDSRNIKDGVLVALVSG